MNIIEEKAPEKWILWGIPALFTAGSATHFIYNALGKNPVVGALAPVNESVWEHTKMVYVPTLAWWGAYWLKKRKKLPARKWFGAALAALVTAIWVIPTGFYLYTGCIGRHFLIADISLLLLANALGQFMGKHIYKHSKKSIPLAISIGAMILIGLLYALLTFFPLRLPLFISGV